MNSEFEIFSGEGVVKTVHVSDLMNNVSTRDLDYTDMQDLVSGIEREVAGLLEKGQTGEEVIETIRKETSQFKPDVIDFIINETAWCLKYMEAKT